MTSLLARQVVAHESRRGVEKRIGGREERERGSACAKFGPQTPKVELPRNFSPAVAEPPKDRCRSGAPPQSLFPENNEMSFWKAIALLNNGKKEEAKKIFDIVFKKNPNWKKLIYRLPKSGLISMTVKELDLYFKND